MVNQKGYIAVVLVIFALVSLIIISASVGMSISNLSSVSAYEQGLGVMSISESGIENALMRLIRDPTYTGETLTVDGGTAVVTVTGTDPLTIISTGTLGFKQRKLQVIVSRTNGVLSVTSWAEVYN